MRAHARAVVLLCLLTTAVAAWAQQPPEGEGRPEDQAEGDAAPPPIVGVPDDLAPRTGTAGDEPQLRAPVPQPMPRRVEARVPARAWLPAGWRAAPVDGVDDADLVKRALALESVGLWADAQGALRAAARAGLGDLGVEAGRRADAIADLELAQEYALQRKGKPAKAAWSTAVRMLERQEQTPGWPIRPALAAQMAAVGARIGETKAATPWLLRSRSAVGFSAAVAASAFDRSQRVRSARCIGGVDASAATDVVRLRSGTALAVGHGGLGDDEQVWFWQIDALGRPGRAGSFGAAGPDAAQAAMAWNDGAWLAGRTTGPGGGDALILRLDGQLRPVAQHDLDLGGAERAVALLTDADGTPWALVEGDVADPSGPGKVAWLVALRDDGTPRKQVMIPLGRSGFVTSTALDKEAILLGGGRGPGEAAGGLLRTVNSGSATLVDDEGPSFPGPILAMALQAKGAVLAIGRQGDGNAGKLWWGGRDVKRRWLPGKAIGPSIQAERAGLLPGKRGALLWTSGGPDGDPAGAVYALTGGKAKALARLEGFRPSAALVEGKDALLVGAARGCGRAGVDAAVVRVGL